ncbi:hypothetical protein KIN20_009039, partial [Parelaphostrongylus tenuis]
MKHLEASLDESFAKEDAKLMNEFNFGAHYACRANMCMIARKRVMAEQIPVVQWFARPPGK